MYSEEKQSNTLLDAFIRNDGRIVATRQLRAARILCPMNTFLFPFDEQTCTFLLYARTPAYLRAEDVYKTTAISKHKNILQQSIGEWSLTKFKPTKYGFIKRQHEFTLNETIEPTVEKVSAIVFVFVIKRNWRWHVLAW